MERTNFTDDEEGKTVVNADGDEIGRIVDVRGGTAYVDPDPGMMDTIRSKLGWGDADDDTYALEDSKVEEITDRNVRLRRL